MSKNKSNEELLNMELKNIQMLILQRSLFILKKKFEINKKPLEVIYQKYKDENYSNNFSSINHCYNFPYV